MLDLSRMNRVLAVGRRRGDGARRASRSASWARRWPTRGLALENQGDVDPQTLAGAVATATHGTGGALRQPLVAAWRRCGWSRPRGEVVELRDGRRPAGRARVARRARRDLRASRCAACPPSRSSAVDEPRRSTTCSRASTSTWTRATTSSCSSSPTRAPRSRSRPSARQREPQPARRAARSSCATCCSRTPRSRLACRLGRRLPGLIPQINRALVGAMSPGEHLDQSHRVYANRRTVRFTEMEYAIPREHTAEALERVLALIERRRLPVGFPIELRVVAGDDALLSHRPGPRHGLHRRAPVPRHGVRELLPRRRGDHGRVRRPAALGQAPLPDAPPRCARATRASTASWPCASASTRSASSQTTT